MTVSADEFVAKLNEVGVLKLTFGEFQHWLDENYPGFAVTGGWQTVSIFDAEGKLFAWTIASATGNFRVRGSLFQYTVK